MTKVLMTADTIGGVWAYACELIGALSPYGFEVTLATMGAPLSPAQARTAAGLANLEVEESDFALEWMPDPWPDVDAAGEWLLGIARRVEPDVVHLNGYVHAVLPFKAPVVTVAHSCVCTWHHAVHGREPGPEWSEYRRRVRLGLQAADAIVAPTRAILRQILRAYGPGVTGSVIPNGRDPAQWSPGRKEPFVLAAGRLWDEAKGLSDLEACALHASWPIFVAGPRRAPGDLGTVDPSRVIALGELAPHELAKWMSRASIYALPARYEPFGLSVLEAALSGCALVLGDLATLREIWGGAALYVPQGRPDVLGDTLAALAADPVLLHAFATAARARALELTPHRMGRAYRALYAELAARTDEVCA